MLQEENDALEQMPLQPGRASSRPTPLVAGLALTAAVILAYMNSLSGPFIFDDLEGIVDNSHIRRLWPLSDMLFNAPPDSPPAGRPIVSLSLAINYTIGGLNVRGYHLFNIAVHLLSVLVLYGLVRRTFLDTRLNARFERSGPFLAFAVTLIWAVHPLHTETVNYVSQRTELLMGLFYLLTLYCAIRAWRSDRPRFWSAASVASCAIGMGCKESMVSAPLIVLLYDVALVSRSFREALRRHASLYVGLAATWVLLAWLNASAPRGRTCGTDLGISSLDYLRTQAGIIVWYLRLAFWPNPLVISYEDWPIARSLLPILPQGLFIVTLLLLTAWALWRRRPAALLGAWFFLILAPTSSFIPIVTELAAERRMYLPLAAVTVASVLGLRGLFNLTKRRRTSPPKGITVLPSLALLLVVATLGYTTALRNCEYRTATDIWADAVAKRPRNWVALVGLACELAKAGQHQEAIKYCSRAIALKPDYIDGYTKRSIAYAGIGDWKKALLDCNAAVTLKPDHVEAYHMRAMIRFSTRDYDQAWADVKRCQRLNGQVHPEFLEALRQASSRPE